MIRDENLWLSALRKRNNVTLSYSRNISLIIAEKAKDKFYDMFCDLKKEIGTNWL